MRQITLDRCYGAYQDSLLALEKSKIHPDIKVISSSLYPVIQLVKYPRSRWYAAAFAVNVNKIHLTSAIRRYKVPEGSPKVKILKEYYYCVIQVNIGLRDRANDNWLYQLISHEYAHLIQIVLDNDVNVNCSETHDKLDHAWLWKHIHKSMNGNGLEYIP